MNTLTDPKFKQFMLDITMMLAREDAIMICYELIHDIKKTGGERQRSEGIKLLYRIYKRLLTK